MSISKRTVNKISCLLILMTGLSINARAQTATVNIPVGTVPDGGSVAISFDMEVVGAPGYPAGTISQQGTFSGNNFLPILTDDPETATFGDPTRTTVYVNRPTIFNVRRINQVLLFDFRTFIGLSYQIQMTPSLDNPNWVTLATFAGTGGERTFNRSIQRNEDFYFRIRLL